MSERTDDLLRRILNDTGIPAVGVAWYSRETYERLAAMPEANIGGSYAEFLQATKRAVASAIAQGYYPVFHAANLDFMIEWCHRRGFDVDERGRFACVVWALEALREEDYLASAPITDSPKRVLQ